MADAGDVRRDLDAAGQPHTRDLAERGVRLLRRGRVNARAHAAPLGDPFRAGVLVFDTLSWRPFRTSCWMVGTASFSFSRDPAVSEVSGHASCRKAMRCGGACVRGQQWSGVLTPSGTGTAQASCAPAELTWLWSLDPARDTRGTWAATKTAQAQGSRLPAARSRVKTRAPQAGRSIRVRSDVAYDSKICVHAGRFYRRSNGSTLG